MTSLTEARIDRLTDEGEILFVYSDKYNIFVIFHKKEDDRLYRIVAHKDYEIDTVEPIETPAEWKDRKSIKFFKPYVDYDSNVSYIGIITLTDGNSFKFDIKYDVMTIKEQTEFEPTKQFNMLKSLDRIEVVSHIQKKNKLFFVGADTIRGDQEAVYGVVDLETDEFEQIYYLYSDKGDIHLNSVNIDTDTLMVSIAGYVKMRDGAIKPYLESLLLRK